MAATYRQVFNRVLNILGEKDLPLTATTVQGDYQRMVAGFMNIIKEEIEDAHNWRSLRREIRVEVPIDAITVTLPGTNERSRMIRLQDNTYRGLQPLAFDVTDAEDPTQLLERDLANIIYRDRIDPTERATDTLVYISMDDSSPTEEIDMYVWPRPANLRQVEVHMTVPQPRLDDSMLDERVMIPVRALELGTLWYAFEERGEELGTSAVFSEQRYRVALDDQIARDAEEQGGYDLIPV